jgi:hypothetical protein
MDAGQATLAPNPMLGVAILGFKLFCQIIKIK